MSKCPKILGFLNKNVLFTIEADSTNLLSRDLSSSTALN